MILAMVSTSKLFFQPYHQDRATTLVCFHICLMTPPCQIWPVPTSTSKTGAHSWVLIIHVYQYRSGMHARGKYAYDHASMQCFYPNAKSIKSNKHALNILACKHLPYQVFKMLALDMKKVLVTCKETSPLQFLFSKISKLPHNSKTALKSISNIFETNTKINQRIFKE